MSVDLSRFTFSDPRAGNRRAFELSPSVQITNIDYNLVVFECDCYALYTDASQISEIMDAALRTWMMRPLIVSICPPPRAFTYDSIPASWHIDHKDRRELRLAIRAPRSLEIGSFFDREGDYETWTFAIPSEVSDIDRSLCVGNGISFDNCLRHAAEWSFVMAIDLDGMLLGFAPATEMFDQFLKLLKTKF